MSSRWALNSKAGKAALFILFLLPGTPKDAMCYALGLSTMSMSEFVELTSLARTPALLASILFGAYASSRSMIVVGVAVALAVAGCYWYEQSALGPRALADVHECATRPDLGRSQRL